MEEVPETVEVCEEDHVIRTGRLVDKNPEVSFKGQDAVFRSEAINETGEN